MFTPSTANPYFKLTIDHLYLVLSVFFKQGTVDKKKCNSTHKGGQVVQWRVGQWAQLTQVIWQCLSTLCVVDGTGVVGVHPLVLVVMGLGRRARMGWEPRWIAYAEVWGATRTCKNWH